MSSKKAKKLKEDWRKQNNRTRRKAKEKKEDAESVELHKTLRTRCRAQLDEALSQIKKFEIAFKDFASSQFDCRECPMFTACSIDQNFTDHPQDWKFPWMDAP